MRYIRTAIHHPNALAIVALIALLSLTIGCQSGAHVASSTRKYAPHKTGFVERKVVVDGFIRPVWVFVPTNYDPHNLYPTILFLHGLFEQGNGNSNVLSAGLGPVIARNPDAWPFLTIFPQSTGSWKGDDRDHLAMAALKDVEEEYAIDPDRVILAGLSYGGLGVWQIGAKHRERFAALVPVSGPSDSAVANQLGTTPVWAFASKEDPFVKAENSQEMCRAIQSYGGRPRLTEFEGNEHDCWAMAVDQSQLVAWMLNQARTPIHASSRGRGGLRAWNDP